MSNSTPSDPFWRVIDANVNRTLEAFRVVEDCLRFVVEDSLLTNVCKKLRHEFSDWTQQCTRFHAVAMRDAARDVGRESSVPDEYCRTGVDDLLSANLSRAKQSLRVLEEFSKSWSADAAKLAEQIRYQTYDLEKSIQVVCHSLNRLSTTQLYVLTDSCGGPDSLIARIRQLVEGGADAIQLRDTSAGDRELLELAKILVAETRPRNVLSIINNRVDIAVAADSDAVHLGQDDLPIAAARKQSGAARLIGVSTHNLQQVQDAVRDGANYIGVGPTFVSTTKHFAKFTGTELLRQVVGETRLPAFAIGGINLDNLDEVLDSGFHRVALAGAVSREPSRVTEIVQKFKTRLQRPANPV